MNLFSKKSTSYVLISLLVFMTFNSCKKTEQTEQIDVQLSSTTVNCINTKVKDTVFLGQSALRVSFTDYYEMNYLTVQGNGYAEIPISFHNGTIEFDIALELNMYGDTAYTRGFGGILYRKQNEETYECFYLRATNGSLNTPPTSDPERLKHAIQYISAPIFHFDTLRTMYPDVYEKPAKIAINRWHHIKLEVNGEKASVFIDNEISPSITVDKMFGANKEGNIGLYVDQGTNAYFKKMTVTKK
jgi:hypothetical protein